MSPDAHALALVQQEAEANARLIAAGRTVPYRLRDSTHVDGLPVPPPGRHALRAPICIDGQGFVSCACGWVRAYIYHPPTVCGVAEAERERTIALWCAEKRIDIAKARGEWDAKALQRAMAAERR